MIHRVKIADRFYAAVVAEDKTFEIRKDDRNYQVGDRLLFLDPEGKDRKGGLWAITYKIGHPDFPDGIPEGYCVMAIKPDHDEEPPSAEIAPGVRAFPKPAEPVSGDAIVDVMGMFFDDGAEGDLGE